MNPHHRTLAAHALCVAFAFLTAPRAQDLEHGWSGAVRDLPAGAGQAIVLPDLGAVVYFTGTRLVLDDGASARDLLSFASATFGAFTIRVDRDHVLFGDSISGDLWLVPLGTGTPRAIATTTFPYDAALFATGTVIVSAKTGGFGSADNDLLALDLATGALTPLARLPGASGPVAVDAHGLYYATSSNSFPAPPGSSDVLLFPRRTVRLAIGRRTLGIADARVVARGFDAAADLAVDREGDLFVVDFVNSTVVEWQHATGTMTDWIRYPPSAPPPGALQLVAGGGDWRAAFAPFQPIGRQALVVHESAFGGASRLRTIRPARASLSIAGGTRPSLTASGLAPDGTGVLLVGPGFGMHEIALPLPVVDVPLFVAPTLLGRHAVAAIVPIAADGTWSAAVALPPAFPLPLAAQLVFVDAQRGVVASTPPLALP